MKVVKILAAFFALTPSVLNLETHAQVLGYEEFLLTDYGSPLQTGFYQVVGNIAGDIPDQMRDWKHLIVSRHSNADNNHQLQLASSFASNDRLFFRKVAGEGTNNPQWLEVATRAENMFTGNQFFPGMGVWNSTGNVGIGTTNTKGYKLAVAGSMIAESIKVKLSGAWPDYVFAKSYPLPSLSETERHIKENGHLPGIPSAAQVKENGIDLGEMNMKLLTKIEELTLYVIELKKETERQQKQIDALKGRE